MVASTLVWEICNLLQWNDKTNYIVKTNIKFLPAIYLVGWLVG